MAKRKAEIIRLPVGEPRRGGGTEKSAAEFQQCDSGTSPRPGFHLIAARKIEEARERRQLRKALEDFDDYDV